jgi:hypothetical protein
MVHALYSNHEFLNLKTIYTVPNEMLDPKLLKPIQKEFQNKNLQSQFYSSITRTALTQDAELEARLVAAKKGVEEGWLDGVDLVGSLHDDQMGPVDPTMIKNQLKKVFKASHDSALGVRIHAFESTSKGGFYDGLSAALWSCVREKCLPSELRVGHIQELEPKMIEAFENFRHVAPEMKLVFEVNLASNLQLVKGDLERLVSTIHDLHQRGMRVVIGSDGAGILGAKSRFDVAILKFQEVGMHGGSIDRLIEEAYTPLSHPPLAPGVPERWRHQMELVKKVVKVERVRARGENPSCNPSFLLKEINGNFPLDLDQ